MTEKENINNEKIKENNQTENKAKWTDKFKSVKTENGSTDIASKDEDLIKKLTDEVENLKSRLLRSLAEVENTRRICEEEKVKTAKFALTNFVKQLINVMENFYLAFDNLQNKNGEFEAFTSGIEMNFNEFKKIFENNGVKRIYPSGEQFNPEFHEAISQIESEEESGTIIEVLQAGYLLNDRVIKPAMVVVAK